MSERVTRRTAVVGLSETSGSAAIETATTRASAAATATTWAPSTPGRRLAAAAGPDGAA